MRRAGRIARAALVLLGLVYSLPVAATEQQDTIGQAVGSGSARIRLGLAEHGIRPELVEIADAFANISGGVQRGAALESFTKLGVALDLDKMAGWSGASAYVSASGVVGHGVSSENLGNLLFVTDIDTRRGLSFYKGWVEQQLAGGRLSFRLGLEEPGDDFARHSYSGTFLNSTFSFPALGAFDINAPKTGFTFANPGLRARARWKITQQVELMAAIYRADFANLPTSGDSSGLLEIAELRYVPSGGGVAGFPVTYKLGGWYQSGKFADYRYDQSGLLLAASGSTGKALLRQGNHGVFAVIDQVVWKQASDPNRAIGVFLRGTVAPGDRNFFSTYLDMGLVWKKPFGGELGDSVGLAIAYAGIGRSVSGVDKEVRATKGTPVRSSEIVYELDYQRPVSSWLTLQPVVQYVLRPGAGVLDPAQLQYPRTLTHALAVGVRATAIF